LQGVLFDLDGTLLDIDGEAFLDAYVDGLTAHWAPGDPTAFRQAVMAASVPIFAPHPRETNGEVFRQHLARHLGMEPARVAAAMADYHQSALPQLPLPHRPARGARACVLTCLRRGLRLAVATTPIYTPDVIRLRLRWAELDDLPWQLITHSENMHTCKPHADYYAEVAELLGLPPAACLMVGDDPLQDGPAAEVGMATLMRTQAGGDDGWGDLTEVAAAIATAEVVVPAGR
jgi:FMN phosphatase YigB (HAD superfamily)